MEYIYVFFLLFVLDISWSFYLNNVKNGNPLTSGGWAAFLYVLGASATISVVGNPWLLSAAAVGAFAGTYVGVYWNNRKNKID